jgi:hypothetical protein
VSGKCRFFFLFFFILWGEHSNQYRI